jgi:hypothetical protein
VLAKAPGAKKFWRQTGANLVPIFFFGARKAPWRHGAILVPKFGARKGARKGNKRATKWRQKRRQNLASDFWRQNGAKKGDKIWRQIFGAKNFLVLFFFGAKMTPWRPFWRFFVVFFGAFLSPIFFWRYFLAPFLALFCRLFLAPNFGTKMAPCRHGVFLAPKLLIRLGARRLFKH